MELFTVKGPSKIGKSVGVAWHRPSATGLFGPSDSGSRQIFASPHFETLEIDEDVHAVGLGFRENEASQCTAPLWLICSKK